MWISDGLMIDGYVLMALKAMLADDLMACDSYTTQPHLMGLEPVVFIVISLCH
jgi:hypothetical protein